MPNRTTALERAGAWFLQSGIQEPGGGVARYYRSDVQKNARVSTEITGYAVSFLVYLYRNSQCQAYLDAAIRAARFLTRQAWDERLGVFPFEHSANGSRPDPLAYFFDSGIIVRGLLALWRVTGDREFLDTAAATGRGMLAHFHGPESTHPILTLPDRRPRPYDPRWSASPGCYQLKSAMGWYDLFLETGETAFQDAYESSVERCLATHESFLPGDTNLEKVMDRLHAYLYFLEGLLPCCAREDCAAALRTGIVRVAGFAREISPTFARSDVFAQLLRIRLFASDHGIADLDVSAATQEAEHAARFQFASEDVRFQGGFGFGLKQGAMMPFVNPVSTAFGAQAIEMWRARQEDRPKPDRTHLV